MGVHCMCFLVPVNGYNGADACLMVKRQLPADIIQVNLRMVPKTAFERASAVVVLHSVSIVHLDLSTVHLNNQFYPHLTVRSQQKFLKLLWVL